MARNFYMQGMEEGDKSPPSIVFENSKPEGYTLIGVTHPLIDGLINKKYDEYKKAGIQYYNDTRVQLVKAKLFGGLAIDDAVYIEKKLDSVISFLEGGNWESAKITLLNEVITDGILSQDFYDKILNDIQEYILKNY